MDNPVRVVRRHVLQQNERVPDPNDGKPAQRGHQPDRATQAAFFALGMRNFRFVSVNLSAVVVTNAAREEIGMLLLFVFAH